MLEPLDGILGFCEFPFLELGINGGCLFLLLSGDDPIAVAVMAIGGKGLISVASNAIPSEMVQMIELSEKGDFAGARRLHRWLLPLLQVNFIEANPIPVKAARVISRHNR